MIKKYGFYFVVQWREWGFWIIQALILIPAVINRGSIFHPIQTLLAVVFGIVMISFAWPLLRIMLED